MRRRGLTLAATALTALTLTATSCARDAEVENADRRRCDADSELGSAWDAFTDGEITAEDRDRLVDALVETGHANSEVAQAESRSGNNPLHEFNETLQDTEGQSLAEIADTEVTAFGQLLQGFKDMFTDRGCPD